MGTNAYTFQADGRTFRFILPEAEDHIARQIIEKGTFYESAMLADIRKRVNPGAVILDVGANIGNHTVYCAAFCPDAQVIAFEPNPQAAAIFTRNVALNGLGQRVTLHQVAVGDRSGHGSLRVTNVANLGATEVESTPRGEISVQTLDSLTKNLNRCDVIKVDVEGMELPVLSGGFDLIRRFRPLIYVECRDDRSYEAVVKRLQPIGYRSTQVFNATPTFRFECDQVVNTIDPYPYRISFFAGDGGNFHFLRGIITYFRSLGGEVHVVDSKEIDTDQIRAELQWCDLAWFDWGNGPIVAATRFPKSCRIVCRVHKYEIYTGEAKRVNWSHVDDLVVVAPRFIHEFKQHVNRNIEHTTRVHVIPNAIDPSRFPLKEKQRGSNIAHITRFHPDKNPALLLHIMHALVQRDDGYRCFVAGRVQDIPQYEYFKHMRRELGLDDHVICEGYIEDISSWLEDKHYLLSTSVIESQGVGVMEAMARGLKPVIHNHYGGAVDCFGKEHVFNTIDQAVEMILSPDYRPAAYRSQVFARYGSDRTLPRYKELVTRSVGPTTSIRARETRPRVSILVPSHNRAAFIAASLDSALAQDYDNFEVCVVDDGSTDATAAVLSRYKDRRLRVINKEHSGAPDTRNRAVREAQGTHVLWLDSDDLLLPSVLTRYANTLSRYPDADVVYGDLEIFDEYGNRRALTYPDLYFDRNLLGRIIRSNVIPNPGCLVRKGLYQEVGVFDTCFPRAHDYEFWSRAVTAARFKHGGITACRWRWHGNNMSAENQQIDRSFEARIVRGLIERHALDRLFPLLDWSHEEHAKSRAHLLLAKIFLRWESDEQAWCFLNKAVNGGHPSEELLSLRARLEARDANRKGEAAYREGNMAVASDYFQHAVALDDSYADAYNNLALCFRHSGDDARALRCLTKALHRAPNDDNIAFNTAAILVELGKPSEAIELCEVYLERNPFASMVRNLLTEIVLRLHTPPPTLSAAGSVPLPTT